MTRILSSPSRFDGQRLNPAGGCRGAAGENNKEIMKKLPR
jgi:hypothetical protein